MADYKIYNEDNMEVLRRMEANSLDAVVTDAPYGLGKEPDALELIKAWADTGYLEIKGKGFMGKEWDAFVPQPAFWKEVYRVLKPGGYVLCFFGTRTYDWGTLSIRLAGFEIRDCIQWIYGSGFPKSLDVSKSIDQNMRGQMVRAKLLHFAKVKGIDGKWVEAQGIASAASFNDWTVGGHVPSDKNWLIIKRALNISEEEEANFERVVIGHITKARSTSGDYAIPTIGGETAYKSWNITASATDEAKTWEGWGTALKPAYDPICVARKPLDGTVAENVLKHQCGAINLDGCRIPFLSDRDLESATWASGINIKGGNYNGNSSPSGEKNIEPNPAGRFPANIILDEEAADILDQQSGVLTSGQPVGIQRGDRNRNTYGKFAGDVPITGYGDTGGGIKILLLRQGVAFRSRLWMRRDGV